MNNKIGKPSSPFPLRLNADLLETIKAVAKMNCRSVNGEIAYHLEKIFIEKNKASTAPTVEASLTTPETA